MRELSHHVTDAMMVYPGDPEVSINPGLTLDLDGVNVTQLQLGSHTGTHLDAPSHTVAQGRTTGQINLEELTGKALIVHLTGLTDHQEYGLAEISAALGGTLPTEVPSIVIMNTGWAQYFNTTRALNHPHISVSAARELRARGMHVLAVDTLSPDPTGQEISGFPVHEVILGNDDLIVENITGLRHLPTTIDIGFFPMRLDSDGAPVRAIAFNAPAD